MKLYKCERCGNIFEETEIKRIPESRGEFWGMPAFETMCYSPCCTDDFWDYEPEEGEEVI